MQKCHCGRANPKTAKDSETSTYLRPAGTTEASLSSLLQLTALRDVTLNSLAVSLLSLLTAEASLLAPLLASETSLLASLLATETTLLTVSLVTAGWVRTIVGAACLCTVLELVACTQESESVRRARTCDHAYLLP